MNVSPAMTRVVMMVMMAGGGGNGDDGRVVVMVSFPHLAVRVPGAAGGGGAQAAPGAAGGAPQVGHAFGTEKGFPKYRMKLGNDWFPNFSFQRTK